jgi:NADPH-dependent ferric siderophore reductase
VSRAPIGAFEATVLAVEDLSPSFRRVTFGGAGLQDFGPAPIRAICASSSSFRRRGH